MNKFIHLLFQSMKNFKVLWSETAAAKASLLNAFHGSDVGLGWMPLWSCLASIAPLRGGYCYLPSRRRKCQGRRVGTWTQDYCSWPHTALSLGTNQKLILTCPSRGGGSRNTGLLWENWGGVQSNGRMWGILPESSLPRGQAPQMARVPQKQEREPWVTQ